MRSCSLELLDALQLETFLKAPKTIDTHVQMGTHMLTSLSFQSRHCCPLTFVMAKRTKGQLLSFFSPLFAYVSPKIFLTCFGGNEVIGKLFFVWLVFLNLY